MLLSDALLELGATQALEGIALTLTPTLTLAPTPTPTLIRRLPARAGGLQAGGQEGRRHSRRGRHAELTRRLGQPLRAWPELLIP